MKNKLNINDLPPAMQARVREQAQAEGLLKPKPARHKPNEGDWQGKEKDLQKHVEEFLQTIGFEKRTKKAIERTEGKGGKLGWQIHVARTIGNPYLLDILLLGNDGHWLELELKTATGRLTDQQALLVSEGKVCRKLTDVKAEIFDWMARIDIQK